MDTRSSDLHPGGGGISYTGGSSSSGGGHRRAPAWSSMPEPKLDRALQTFLDDGYFPEDVVA